jgi:dienelactone hydrolase
VLLFDHRCTGESACASGDAAADLMSDIRGAVFRLRQEGAARVALVGASQGGSEALTAAAVSQLCLPALFAMAAKDPFVSVRDTRRLFAATGSHSKHLIVLRSGAGHGWDLVSSAASGGARPAFSRMVLAFLQRVTS